MTHDELYALACMAVDVAAGEGRLETGSHGTVDERQQVMSWLANAAAALTELHGLRMAIGATELHELTERLSCKHDHLVCGIVQHEEHPPLPPRTYEALVCCSDCGTYFRNAREMRDAGIFERGEAIRRAAVDAVTTVPSSRREIRGTVYRRNGRLWLATDGFDGTVMRMAAGLRFDHEEEAEAMLVELEIWIDRQRARMGGK